MIESDKYLHGPLERRLEILWKLGAVDGKEEAFDGDF